MRHPRPLARAVAMAAVWLVAGTGTPHAVAAPLHARAGSPVVAPAAPSPSVARRAAPAPAARVRLVVVRGGAGDAPGAAVRRRELRILGTAGRDAVTVTRHGGRLLVTATRGRLAAGDGCRAASGAAGHRGRAVSCPAASRLRAALLGGDDALTVTAAARLAVRAVDGGPGADVLADRSPHCDPACATATGAGLHGGAGDDRLHGPRLDGGPGADRLTGTPGDDVLSPGPGRDTVRAGAGDDLVRGPAAGARVDAGPGDDRVALTLADPGAPRTATSTLGCGPGADTVDGPAVGDLLRADCERVRGIADLRERTTSADRRTLTLRFAPGEDPRAPACGVQVVVLSDAASTAPLGLAEGPLDRGAGTIAIPLAVPAPAAVTLRLRLSVCPDVAAGVDATTSGPFSVELP
ncbi:hypothetical protein GKE82_06935 [Conexibacter sp. W3-3-2]|uniref:calcium-binding protein n=1 Tax=Conexibacter sp. W3-3-2 TaxID=2675227 RepID=UPI0012B8C078|nr:hypothetical protein [Conexibacter sp. W3-3-2]MTD44043.1 hypothetical protein [Conexibacter sp. W3-3-2]